MHPPVNMTTLIRYEGDSDTIVRITKQEAMTTIDRSTVDLVTQRDRHTCTYQVLLRLCILLVLLNVQLEESQEDRERNGVELLARQWRSLLSILALHLVQHTVEIVLRYRVAQGVEYGGDVEQCDRALGVRVVHLERQPYFLNGFIVKKAHGLIEICAVFNMSVGCLFSE